MRIFRVFEDKITLDYRDNPLTIEGMRRDIQRIASHLEHYFRGVSDDSVARERILPRKTCTRSQ